MCDATFTFGQRGSHFFQCSSQREMFVLTTSTTSFLMLTTSELACHESLQLFSQRPNHSRSITSRLDSRTAFSSPGVTRRTKIASTAAAFLMSSSAFCTLGTTMAKQSVIFLQYVVSSELIIIPSLFMTFQLISG